MALISSGPISLSDVNIELLYGATTTISLNDSAVRGLFGIASGTISLLNGYGASSIIPKGYWGGGQTSVGDVKGGYTVTPYNEIDGMVFSTETAMNPAATLVYARHILAGINSLTKGYWGGGSNGTFDSVMSEIDGINFGNDSAINPAVALSVSRSSIAGVNSPSNGYFAGGSRALVTFSAAIEKFIFSNESISTLATTMVVARAWATGLNSPSYGYFYGSGTVAAEIDGINFSNDTSINPASTSSVIYAGSVNSPTAGYLLGGSTSIVLATIFKFTFSTETSSTLSATLSTAMFNQGSDNGVTSLSKGYVGGGQTYLTGGYTAAIQGFIFASETSTTTSALLSLARTQGSGVSSGSL